MALNLDVSKLTQSAAMKPTAHDNCIVLDLGTGAYPRDIEVRLPDDDGARQNALYDGSLDLAVNDEVLCFEYSGLTAWRVMAMGGNDSGAGQVRVSKIWESDFGAVALQADAAGDIGIGTTGPDAKLDILDMGGAQLRLTFEDGVKFADLTLDTNQDLTITPSGTGQVKFQPTTDSAGFFQVLNASGATRVFSVDTTNKRVAIATINPDATLEVLDATGAQLRLTFADSSKFVDFTVDTNHDLLVKPSATGQIKLQPTTDSVDFFQVLDADGGTPVLNVDSTNERIGIGTAGPTFALHISKNSNGAERVAIANSNAGASAQALFQATNDNNVSFQATVGSSTHTSIPDTVAFQANGGDLLIRTILASGEIIFSGGAAGTVEIARMTSSKRLGIDAPSPAATLHADQSSTTAAIPVLFLDQADVSEEMIEFATTIGVGNAIEAVGAKTLTVTHFIKVTLPGALTRYIEVGTIA